MNLIKQKRFELGISQNELSNRTKISRTLLSNIENEKANPTTRTLQKIAKALDVKVSDLLEEN